MERGVLTYIIAFICGIGVANVFLPPSSLFLFLSPFLVAVLLFVFLLFRKRSYGTPLFVAVAHLILFLAGISRFTTGQDSVSGRVCSFEIPLRDELKSDVEGLVRAPQEQAVLTALTLGDKNNLPADLKKAYGTSGAMHILALSGLHMGVLYGFISGVLFFLNLSRRLRILKALAASLLILLYGYMTGFPPSVQRAIIMILFQNVLYLSGRKAERINLIAVTAFVILLIRPEELFSISFQLSFAAVIGIALIFPVIEASFTGLFPVSLPDTPSRMRAAFWKWGRKGCYATWCLIGISVSCQITTLPFTLFYFKSAPPFFLLTNLAAIPIASTVLYLFIPAVLMKEIPFLGEGMGWILQKLLELLNGVIQFIG